MVVSISIVYVLIDETIRFEDLKEYLCYLPSFQQKQVLRYRREQDQIASLISKLLIQKQASLALHIPKEKLELAYTAFGKPYIANNPTYHFSISHSERCVAFVEANHPIGLDVERLGQADEDVAKMVFATQEWQYFCQSGFSSMAFYELWTQKEAYVKRLGTGMATPLLSFDVKDDSLKKTLWSTYLEGYWLSLCSLNLPYEQINLEKLNLKDLFIF